MGRIFFGAPTFRLRHRRRPRLHALAVAIAALLALPGDVFAWEAWHVDLPGHDYAAFCTRTADQCRELCRAQAQCKAYTYISVAAADRNAIPNLPAWMRNCVIYTYGVASGGAACFLKSREPQRVSRPQSMFQRHIYTYKSGAKEARHDPRTTPRGCQWGNSITRPGQRACFCWQGSYQVERPIHVCQGN